MITWKNRVGTVRTEKALCFMIRCIGRYITRTVPALATLPLLSSQQLDNTQYGMFQEIESNKRLTVRDD